MNLLKVLGHVIKEVAKKNEADPVIKTADPVVFDEVQKKIEQVDFNEERSRIDVYKEFEEKVREAQMENEASPTVETADASVFDEMRLEIERLKEKMILEAQAENQNTGTPAPTFEQASTNMGAQAMTNSMGGSLQIRQTPDMGAQVSHVRIPDNTLINVLKYSDNSIILDGKRSRFALIEFNGQQGWILENYLNFN